MFRTLALISLITPALAVAEADPRFVALRDKAEPLGSLGQFLEKYVGNCDSPLAGGGECLKNSAQYRDAANGKKFYMIINEGDATMLQMGPYNPKGDEFTILMTPFFPASNSALTHGAPTKADAAGNPVMPFMEIKGPIPEMGNVGEISRAISSRQLRLQIVFTPQGMWSLPKKGGGKNSGVRARLDAVLVTLGRTGLPLALWLNKAK